MGYMDKTWCASPDCINKCGRKLSEKDKELIEALGQYEYLSYAYFCGMGKDASLFDRIMSKIHAGYIKTYES